jgi:hypothetical protein
MAVKKLKCIADKMIQQPRGKHNLETEPELNI